MAASLRSSGGASIRPVLSVDSENSAIRSYLHADGKGDSKSSERPARFAVARFRQIEDIFRQGMMVDAGKALTDGHPQLSGVIGLLGLTGWFPNYG
jgi:hypothetical protein